MALALWLNSDTVHTNLAHIETEVQNTTGGALLDTSRLAAESERIINYAGAAMEVAEQQLQQLDVNPAGTLSATELAAAYEHKGVVSEQLTGLSMSELATRADKVATGTDRVQQYLYLRHLHNALQASDSGPRRVVDGITTELPATVGTMDTDRAALHAVSARLGARLLGHFDTDSLQKAQAAAQADVIANRKLKIRAGRALSKLGVAQAASTLNRYSDF